MKTVAWKQKYSVFIHHVFIYKVFSKTAVLPILILLQALFKNNYYFRPYSVLICSQLLLKYLSPGDCHFYFCLVNVFHRKKDHTFTEENDTRNLLCFVQIIQMPLKCINVSSGKSNQPVFTT